MPTCTEAEARERLPELLDASARGERVVITRDGRAVAELVPPQSKMTRAESVAWIGRELADLPPAREDSVAQLNALRDERP